MEVNLPLQFGRFELLELLGTGGMAEVYKAKASGELGFERIVVIKKILPSFATNDAFIQMLIQEAKLASLLQHANVVQTLDLGKIEDNYFICMEYVPGTDLLKTLTRFAKKELRIPYDIVAYIISEAARGLHYAHGACNLKGEELNIIHRDVSPANILISYNGAVKLTDFGVARANMVHDAATKSGVMKGKMGYMSPEQVSGRPFDHRADIFALGVLLYESLTLKRLFLGKDSVQTLFNVRDADIQSRLEKHPYLPAQLGQIMIKALETDPDARYQTAQEISNDLRAYLQEIHSPVGPEALSLVIRSVHGWDDLKLSKTPGWFRDLLEQDDPRDPTLTTSKMPLVVDMSERTPLPSETSAAVFMPGTAEDPSELTMMEMEQNTYFLKSAADQILGPVSFSHISRMIEHGALSQDEPISLNQANWVRVGDLPLLQPLFSRNASIKSKPATLEGPASLLSLPFAMYRIAAENLDGLLSVQDANTLREAFFKKGKLLHIHSSDHRELFGAYLVEHRVVSLEHAQMALEELDDDDCHLGDIIVAKGWVDEEELEQLLLDHQKSRFKTLLSCESGWMSFYEGDEYEVHAGSREIDVAKATTKALRHLVTKDYLERVFHGFDTAPVRPATRPPINVDQLALSEREMTAAQALRRARNMDHARKNCEHPDLIPWAAYVLVQAEILRFPKGNPVTQAGVETK
jgi:serine/threonine protein kinase